MATATPDDDLQRQSDELPPAPAKTRSGLIVVTSMAVAGVAALILVALPFIPAEEHVLTGLVMLGFAFGWALLAVLSVRFTDQPQRWAAAPAAFFALVGLACLSGSTLVHAGLSWVWPPTLLVLVVWMFLRVRKQLPGRGARWLLYPILAVLAVAAVGGGYETVREALDARAHPMPGRLVDVGGHRLHLQCTGTGSPTVVLEPGLGGASSDFGWITPVVASDTRVCVYDRAGRGWSDAADGPQDGAQVAADLHTLLDRAQIAGPYVLAGHSFGGLYVLRFAAQFPDDIAGLVLLDSTAPKPGPALPTAETDTVIARVIAVLPAAAHLGVGRLIAESSASSLPPRSAAETRANSSTDRYLASYLEEFRQGSASTQQAAALTSLNSKPLIVVTADSGSNDDQWRSKQEHLGTLSTNVLHRHADATHASLIDDAADSAVASNAILDVVAAVQSSRPLS